MGQIHCPCRIRLGLPWRTIPSLPNTTRLSSPMPGYAVRYGGTSIDFFGPAIVSSMSDAVLVSTPFILLPTVSTSLR